MVGQARAQLHSHVRLFVVPRTVAHQAPLSMGFSREEYYSGCRFFFQGIFPTQGSKLCLIKKQNRKRKMGATWGSLAILKFYWVHG